MDSGFPTTKYSLVAQLRSRDPLEKKAALSFFVAGYRRALLNFLIAVRGINQNDAEDIVQDFIVEKIMSGKVLNASSKPGKFRNLLRKSLQNYLIDSLRKRNTNQKNFESNSGLFAVENIKEEFDVFDELWAKGVFTAVLKQMQTKSQYWDVFKARVLSRPPKTYLEIVEICDFEDPAQASNALMTAKRTFMRLISETICDSREAADSDNMEEEIRQIKNILLNTNEFIALVDSLDSIDAPVDGPTRLPEGDSDNAVSLELGPIIENQWSTNEIEKMLDHLFENRISKFLNSRHSSNTDFTLKELLFDDSASPDRLLDTTKKLKQFFKSKDGDDNDSLPKQVLVTVVFALIARYIQLGGQVSGITSIEPNDLKLRLRSMTSKPWISQELKGLFDVVVRQRE